MAINGLPEGMTTQELRLEVSRGAKFVVFEYTVSILILTFKRGSGICYIRPGESALVKSLPYTGLTLVAGWWGIPWGPIYSVMALFTNLSGGKDVTTEVARQLGIYQR